MGFRLRSPSRTQISRWLTYSLFAGFFISLPIAVVTPPPAEAASFGTIYNAPEYFFGGGTNSAASDCAAGQVVVGITFNQNTMVVGKICAPLLPDYTIAALSTATRNTAGYVFCPDGMAAVGTKYISSSGLRAGLFCKTPPLVNDTGVETAYVASNGSPQKLTRTTQTTTNSLCNAGDLMVGIRYTWNLWLDSHGARCAPYVKFSISYNANNGVGAVPATVTQTIPNEDLTVVGYTGNRPGYHYAGWNTNANGTGRLYQDGDVQINMTASLSLFAEWDSTIIYDTNSATSGSVPAPTLARTSNAVTTLATNSGTLARAGYTFGGWNTRADGSGTNYAAGLTTYASPGDTTLYAQWNSTITYSGNGNTSAAGTVPAVRNMTGSAGQVFALPAPTSLLRTNFVFAGWNTAANRSGTSYLPGETYTATGSATLYAMWNLNLTFNGNTSTTGTLPSAITTNEYSSPTIPGNIGNLVKTGSTFVGWNTLANGTGTRYLPGDTITATGSAILYAEWITTCTPGTSYADGNQILTVTQTGACAFTLPDSATTIDFLTVGGGGGGGTNAGSGGAGGGVVYQTSVPIASGQVVIVNNGAGGAISTAGGASTFTIGKSVYTAGGGAGGPTYLAGRTCSSTRPLGGSGSYATGGRGGNGAGGTPQAGCLGETGTVLSITGTRKMYGAGGGGGGYDGAGGLAGGGNINSGAGDGGRYAPATAGVAGAANTGGGGGGGGAGNASGGVGGSGVTVIALGFLALVTYDSNTAASGASTDSTQMQSSVGETLTATTQGTLSKSGFTFSGWNTQADGKGINIPAGSLFTPQGPTRLYAQWNYTVIYDGNGHTLGTIADSVTVTSSISTITLDSATGISRTGYTFAGWNTLANGSGARYDSATANWKSAQGDITLYAQWNAIITFTLNGAETGTVPSAVLTTGTGNGTFNLPSPTNVKKAGTTFAGWNTNRYGTGTSYAPGASYTTTGAATLYAQYNATLTYLANGATSGTAPGQVISPYNGNTNGCKLETGYTHCRTFTFPAPPAPTKSNIALNLEANPAYINGASWYDNTASGIVGTAVNAPTYDPVEKAWTFNGTNQYFNLGNVLNYATGAFTIEVTFKPAALTGFQALVGRHNAGVAGSYFTALSNNKVSYHVEAAPWVNDFSNSSLTTGQKYVATQVFDSSYNIIPYLNGVMDGSVMTFGALYASTVNLTIGALLNNGAPTAFFNGKIYSVRIYSKALSATEVAQNYLAITTPAPTTYDQTFVVPGNIPAGQKILVESWGAGGGGAYYSGYANSGAGGAGGYSKSTVLTTGNPETWTVVVGQGGEAYDLTPQYGGGGAGGLVAIAQKGSSGGGMSGIFIGSDTSTPLIITGGGGGTSPGGAVSDGGGGGAGYGTGGAATLPARTGRGGTLTAGGAAATATTVCTIAQTAGRYQQGGSGAGHPTSTSGAEGGGGGGGGYYGGGGGHCDAALSNGGGGGGSGYADFSRVTLIDSATGATGIVTPATAPGGLYSINYSYPNGRVDDGSIGVGFGGNGNAANFVVAKGGDGMVVIQWNDPADSWIASPNINTMVRPGFTFSGWNTKADGTGTHYDTGTAIERVNTTLYAEWRYTIHYDGNTNTSGVAPDDQIAYSSSGVTTIADNPNTLTKTGYSWDGWNNQADGKGTNYTATGDLLGLPNPYMRFQASNYDTSTKVWMDSSGNGRNSIATRGVPTKTTSGADNGMSKNFVTIKGGTTAGIKFNNPQLAAYTLCYIARYAGPTRARMIDTVAGNWLSGFFGDAAGVAHHGGWITPSSTVKNDLTWHIICDSGDNLRDGGVVKNTATTTVKYLPANLTVNYGEYSGSTQASDFEIAELLVFDSYLTTTQMQQIESYMADTYGYVPSGSLAGLPAAYLQLEATNYDPDTKVWFDSSGNNRDVSNVRGNPTVVTNAPGLGATKNVTAVKGAAATAGITLNNPLLANYTLCYVARYGGTTKGRIFDGYSTNWLSGFYAGSNDLAYHEGWLTATTGTTGNNWTWNCDAGAMMRSRGVIKGTTGGATTALPASLTINNYGGVGRSADISDWEVAEVFIFDRTLTQAQMFQIEGYFTSKYGLWTPVITSKRNTNFTSPSGDLTLYAQWNSYITYDSNTATSGTVPLPQLMVADTPVVLSTNVGTLAKSGNSFLGWNTQADGLGISYSVSDTYTPTANATLYARWGSSVTFDTNTGTSGSLPANTVLAPGSSLTLASGTIAKSGYTFAGWNTAANGSGTHYDTGTAFTTTSNITLYAQWNSLIRFDINGGTGAPNIDSITATGTVAVTLATAGTMARTGFTFNGWNTAANGTGTLYAAGLATYAPAGNITLYAKWTGNPYTITFHGNGNTGGTVAAKAITGGTPVALTANTYIRTGYSFNGWIETMTSITADYADGSTQTFYSNKTLYALWKPDVYTISYNANTGALGAASKASETYTVGTAGLTLATVGTMQKQGYRFTGWSATQAGTTALTSPYVASASVTLYAIWSANQYRLTYDSNTGTSGTIAAYTLTAGTAFSLSAVTGFAKTGFTATGWNTAANGTGTGYTSTQSITLYDTTTVYAMWKPVAPAAPSVLVAAGNTSATISVNGGTLSGTNGPADSYTVVAKIGSTIYGSCLVVAPATSCTITGLTNGTAYTFSATATNVTGTSVAGTGVTGTPQGYRVTYNPMGGTVSPTSETYTAGTPLLLPLPVKSGYNFLGWFDTSTAGTNLGLNGGSFAPTESRTVYAQWSAIPYTISYNGNGATAGTAPASGTYSLTSGAYQIAAKNTLAKVGYIFNGWKSDTGTVFTVGTNYTTAANLNLYANWLAETYTVTYGANGGSGSIPVKTGYVTIGETFTAPSTTITLAGSTFAGWTDGNRTYLPGDVITVGGSNLVLTAVWNGTQYVVLYLLNGGTGTAPTNPNRYLGETLTVASIGAVIKAGYTFAGWSESGTAYAAGNIFTMPARNVTFIAQWSGLSYTITYATTGTTTGTPSRTSDTFTYGGTAISLPTAGTMVKAGYSFVGWKETSTVISGSYSATSNVTLQPVWSATTQTFTFDTNGASGTAPASASYTTGGSAVLAPVQGSLVKAGYTFAGWSDGTNTYQPGDPITGTADKTLTAIWTPAIYTITYLVGTANGNAVTEIVGLPTTTPTAYGSTFYLGQPETRTVTDNGQVYAFAGWLYGGQVYQYNAPIVMGSSAPTFTAEWLRLYEVTYQLAGGAGAVPVPTLRAANYVENITTVIPTKSGYTFSGWVDQSGAAVNGSTYSINSSNYIFFATWTANTYQLGYSSAGGSSAPASTQGTIGTIINLAASNSISKSGYTFAGWSVGGSTYAGGAQYQFGALSETATAIWSPNTQTITIDLAQGTSNTPITVPSHTYGETFTAPTTLPTRTGYTFAGWSDGSTNYSAGSIVTVGATNMTLTAVWNVASYTVTYLLNGGTGSVPNPTAYNFGTIHTIAPGVTKANSNFIGWSNGSNTYSSGASFTISSRNETFTAQFSGAIYALSFTLNGAETGTAPSSITGQITDNFILPSASGIAKTGYIFGGWSDGTSTYSAGDTLTAISSNTTLTAVWKLLPPGTLSAPIATPGDHAGTVNITPPTTGGAVTSYKIVATDSSGVPISPEKSCTVNAPATSCSITGLTNGTIYKFHAIATNAAGTTTSSLSNSIMPASIPGAPTTVTAVRGDESATVSFAAPVDNGGSPITSYTLTVVETGQTILGSGSPITVTGLTNGTSYTFMVSATNAVGISDTSTASAPIKIAGVADAPTSVFAVAGDETATVSATGLWNTVAGSGGDSVTAIIFTSMDGLHTCTAIYPATSCVMTGLTNGTAYTFTAVAKNSVGNSPAATSSSITPSGIPSAPTTVTAIAGDHSATISFSGANPDGAAINSYIVKVSPTGETFTASSSPITITGLTNGGAYTFTVAAVNANGTSLFSTVTATAIPASAPAAPTSLRVLAGDTSTVISWSAPADDGGSPITSYLVTASNSATCTAIAPATSCKISGLINGTSYTFTAQAINAIGTGIATATSPVAIPAGLPTPPTAITAAIGDGQVTLTFSGAGSNGSTITNYTVIASPGGATGTSSSSPVTVLGLTNGTTYTFRVIATNAVGDSESSTVFATATPATVPDSPTALVASAGNGTATISFTAPVDNGGAAITGYIVTASPGGATCTATAGATSCQISGLNNGTTYSFTAVATNAAGSSIASAQSPSVTPVGPPSAPTAVVAVDGDQSAMLTFTAPTNTGGLALDHYEITISPGGQVITSQSTSVNVTGLTNGVIYTATVRAVNSAGTSVGSTGVTLSPAGLPTPPTSVTATPLNNSAQVTFSGATANGSAITAYVVTVVETGHVVNGSSSPITVTGLANGTAYTFTVEAVNSVGTSAISIASAPVTPEHVTYVVVTPSTPAPAPVTPVTPVVPSVVEPTPTPTPTPTVKPTPTPTPTPTVKPTPTPTPIPTVKPTPTPTPTPKVTPKPTATPTPTPKVTPKPTPTPTPTPTKSPLAISTPKAGSDPAKSTVVVKNIKPGQKIKVTIVEGATTSVSPTPKATAKATPKVTPKPTPTFTTKSTNKPTVVPKPSGSSAQFGLKNLKPGQKIKVTIKTGGTNK